MPINCKEISFIKVRSLSSFVGSPQHVCHLAIVFLDVEPRRSSLLKEVFPSVHIIFTSIISSCNNSYCIFVHDVCLPAAEEVTSLCWSLVWCFLATPPTALNDLFFKRKVNIKLPLRNFLQSKNAKSYLSTISWRFYKIITADCYIFSWCLVLLLTQGFQ